MLTSINVVPTNGAEGGGASKRLEISINVGQTLAILVLGLALLVLSAILYVMSKDTPAAGFFAFGEAIIATGLGIAVGRKSGAEEAEKKLKLA